MLFRCSKALVMLNIFYVMKDIKASGKIKKTFRRYALWKPRETALYLLIYIQNWLPPIHQNISILVEMKPICLAMMKNAGLKLSRKENRNCIPIILRCC